MAPVLLSRRGIWLRLVLLPLLCSKNYGFISKPRTVVSRFAALRSSEQEQLPLASEFAQLKDILVASPSALGEGRLEVADRLLKHCVLALAKTAKNVPFDRDINPFLPKAYVSALVFLDGVTSTVNNSSSFSSSPMYVSSSLSSVIRHVPRKNGLSATMAQVGENARRRAGQRPHFENSLLRDTRYSQ